MFHSQRVRLLALILTVPLGRAQSPPPESGNLKERGLTYAKAGNLEAAERELRQAAESAPNDAEILGTLGSILAMSGKLEESTGWLEKALVRDPENNITRRNLATNQWRLGRLPEARRNLERLLQTNPGDQQATLVLGMVVEKQHDYARAAQLLATVPALVRTQPAAITALASAYYHTAEKEKARAALEPIIAHPVNAHVTYVAGRVALDGKDYELAERLFLSIRSSYSDAAALGYHIALAQYHLDRFADSERTLAELVAAGGVTGDTYNLLGWCLEKQGKRGEAIDALSKAIDQEPSNEIYYLDLAGILATSTRRLVAALAIAGRATERLPASYNAWTLKGSIETKLQQHSDAVQSYAVAVKLKPDSPEALRALALARWSNGEDAEAIRSFEQLIKRFPQNAASYEAYGTALFNTASNEELTTRAASLLQKAMALDPSLAEPHFYLGTLALDKGDVPEALHQLERGVKLDPRSSRMHFAFSRALKRAGRPADSKREYATYTKLKSEAEQAESR
jgi:tetratricopeptide (TPR) repeat protein